VLPTLFFVLAAYGLYAIFTLRHRRQGIRPSGRSRTPRSAWKPLVGGGLGLALITGLVVWLSPAETPRTVKLAGIVGAGAPETLGTGKPKRVENLPVKNLQAGNQPTYSFLHPETPPALTLPDKKARSNAMVRKPRAKRLVGLQEKKARIAPRNAKKEPTASQAKPKSKKPQAPPHRQDLVRKGPPDFSQAPVDRPLQLR